MLHVFDIDGTLLDSMPMWNRMPLELLARHGVHIEAGSEEAEKLFRKIDPITSEQGAAWISETYVPDMSPEEVYREMTQYLESQYNEILQPFPDTLDTLQGLHEAGERIVAFSSTDAPLLKAAFERLGISGWFEAIYTTPEIGYNKVSPMAFAEVAKRAGVKPEEMIVYEDSVFAIAAATVAGCLVINCTHE